MTKMNNHYPVSAQYAPLAGMAGISTGRIATPPPEPKPEPTARKKFAVKIEDQILSAVRSIDGPTIQQILARSSSDAGRKNVSSEVSRMCRKSILRADGIPKHYRYYETGLKK